MTERGLRRVNRGGWFLVAGFLVLVGVLSIFGTAREEARAAVGPVTSAHAASASVVEPGTARAELDVFDMQLD